MVSCFPFVLQGISPGSGQAPQLLRQADGSMQAVPRIIIRTTMPPATSAAPAPLQHSPPSQQGDHPVVLNSRVVRDSIPDTPTSAGPPPSYAHWAEQQHQQRHPQPQYGMHQYQEQQPPSIAHAQQGQGQIQAYMQQASHAYVSLAQHQHQPPQQLQYAPQQLPQQGQGQQLPRPGSFQELLSAPLVPEPSTGVPATHGPASRLTAAAATRTKRMQQGQMAPAAAYASQVVRQPPSLAVDAAQLAQNPGLAQTSGMPTIATSQHMFLQQNGDASQRHQQQQQHLVGASPYAMMDRPSSSQLLLQTSSAMYPPIQYPQAVGAIPVLPNTSTGPISLGHPYHGYHTSQAARSVTGPLQLQQQPQLLTHQQQPQQQQQQERQLFQPYAQAQPGLVDHLPMQMPMQSAVHQYQQQQQSAVHHNAATPTTGFASPAHHQMAQVQIGGVTYDPPQRLGQPPNSTPVSLTAFQARPGDQFHPSDFSSFHSGSQQSDRAPQQPAPPSQHARPAQNSSVTHTQGMSYPSQHGAGAATARGEGSGGVPWGSLQGVVPGPTYAPMGQAGAPSPAGSAGGSANQQQMSGLLHSLCVTTAAVVVPAWCLLWCDEDNKLR